jgi:hypothetical protein
MHCIDAHALRERLGLGVYCPAESAAEIGKRVPVDGTLDALPAGRTARFAALAGVTGGEGALLIASGERISLLLCDVMVNVPHLGGLWGLAWRLAGLTGPPRCGPFWLKRAVTDREALRRSIERLAETPGLARLVPSHGGIVEHGPADVLREIGARL